MHEKYIDKIIMSNDNQKMKDLENVLLDTISYIEKTNKNIYCKIADDLYEIAEGKVLTEEKAIEWVNSMQPKARWTLSDVQQIKNRFSTSMQLIPLFIVMNMLYSDMGDVIGEDMNDDIIQKYIKASEDWYYDEDAKHTEDEKIYYYWKFVIN